MFAMFSTLYIDRQTYTPIIFNFHPNRNDFFLLLITQRLLLTEFRVLGIVLRFLFYNKNMDINYCHLGCQFDHREFQIIFEAQSSIRPLHHNYLYRHQSILNSNKHLKQRWIDGKSTGFGTMSIDEDHRSNISTIVYDRSWIRTSKTKI